MTVHHPRHSATFKVATLNDDYNTRKSNLPHMHSGVLLVQEAKNESAKHQLAHADRSYGVHQNTGRDDQQGTAVAWAKDRFHAKRSGYAVGVEPHGRKMLTRWINYTDVVVHGVTVRMVSVHRPPQRFKALWPLFDKNLAHFVKQSKLPLIIGMDANQVNPHEMAKVTGLHWKAPPGSIDGFLVSPGIEVHHVHRLPKGSSDHHPVVGTFTVKQPR